MSLDSGVALMGAGLTLGYRDTTVVHDASLQLMPGRVTALVGPNGSGKSTLLRSLARLHTIESGEVRLGDGSSSLALSARDFARRVTLLSQSRPSPSGLAVRDVVAFGRHPYRRRFGALGEECRGAIAWALEVTGTAAMADRGIDELSGGELQRVWLATCLAQQTGVLLLDEPTNHLDLRYQVEILDLVRDLADDHVVALGIVLHDLNQAAAVADAVVLLDRGRVRASGRPADVMSGDLLSDVYGLTIETVVDPETGIVRTQPRGRHHRSRSTTTTHMRGTTTG
ncbi:MAG: ABC transporter ATP-binding protein [Actinomycetota bacterium]|nr:ABC transporter ATP-binding protein [Actinomycetota bacterium]